MGDCDLWGHSQSKRMIAQGGRNVTYDCKNNGCKTVRRAAVQIAVSEYHLLKQQPLWYLFPCTMPP